MNTYTGWQDEGTRTHSSLSARAHYERCAPAVRHCTFVVYHGEEEAEGEQAPRVVVPHGQGVHQYVKEHGASDWDVVMGTQAFGRGSRRGLNSEWRDGNHATSHVTANLPLVLAALNLAEVHCWEGEAQGGCGLLLLWAEYLIATCTNRQQSIIAQSIHTQSSQHSCLPREYLKFLSCHWKLRSTRTESQQYSHQQNLRGNY